MALLDEIPTEILHVVDADNEHVHVEDDNFWQSLVEGVPHLVKRRCARFVGLVLVAITVVTMVLVGAIFYVQNVLLYQSDMHVNEFGSFVRRSCNSEYAMFLFDTSEPWAASGIQVQKGDRVLVSASGSFHTNMYELIEAAHSNRWADVREQQARQIGLNKPNKRPQKIYRFVNMCKTPLMADRLPVDTLSRKISSPINSKDKALFGDVLMQVIPEYKQRDPLYIDSACVYAIPRGNRGYREVIYAPQSGVLSFCVNDANPYNNLGQILVVMQIFRASTWQQALHGHIFGFLYYWYDYLCSTGHPAVALVLLLLIGVLTFVLLAALAYLLPFVFIRDTWYRIGKVCLRVKAKITKKKQL